MKKLVILLIIILLFSSLASAYKIYYYHNDQLGNPVAITNEQGEVVWKADYEPFGSIFNEENIDTTNKYNYNTKELDKNTNMLYYGARYYDADIGRFTTADTIKGSLINPQSLNRYSYTLNNPMKFIDPSGNSEKPIAVLITNRNYPYVKLEKNMQQYISNYKDKFEFRIFFVYGYEEMKGVFNSVNELINQGREVTRVNFFDEPNREPITKDYSHKTLGLTSAEWLSLPQITRQKGRITILGAPFAGLSDSIMSAMVYVAGSEHGVGVKTRYFSIPVKPDPTKSDEYNLEGILEERYPRPVIGIIPQKKLGIIKPIDPKIATSLK